MQLSGIDLTVMYQDTHDFVALQMPPVSIFVLSFHPNATASGGHLKPSSDLVMCVYVLRNPAVTSLLHDHIWLSVARLNQIAFLFFAWSAACSVIGEPTGGRDVFQVWCGFSLPASPFRKDGDHIPRVGHRFFGFGCTDCVTDLGRIIHCFCDVSCTRAQASLLTGFMVQPNHGWCVRNWVLAIVRLSM